MAHTVTVEVLPNDIPVERMMTSLSSALSECSDHRFRLTKRQLTHVPSDFDAGIDTIMRQALTQSASEDPDFMSIYLSPRRLDFVSENKRTGLSLYAVLMAFAQDGKPVGIFLQTISEHRVPCNIQRALETVMRNAQNRLLNHGADITDAAIVENFVSAVALAYKRAFTRGSTH